MPIARRPQDACRTQPADDAAAEAFIQGAGKPAAQRKPKKERVMIQLSDAMLERIDAAAERRGISRSAWIGYVVSRALDQGEG
jgi:predicted DNA binding CopG/RHH family protein